MRKVYDVGINDANYPVVTTENGKDVWCCPFYKKWVNMLARCYSKAVQNNQPRYIGCSVDERWHSFMTFRSWMEKQDWKGNQLDKDLLVIGNKVYGPDTCLFVSRRVNLFMTDSGKSRGSYPIGVSYTPTGKYKSECGNLGKGKSYLGVYDTPEEAHDVYKRYKAKLAIELAGAQTDERISKALFDRYVKGITNV